MAKPDTGYIVIAALERYLRHVRSEYELAVDVGDRAGARMFRDLRDGAYEALRDINPSNPYLPENA